MFLEVFVISIPVSYQEPPMASYMEFAAYTIDAIIEDVRSYVRRCLGIENEHLFNQLYEPLVNIESSSKQPIKQWYCRYPSGFV